jgi:uncharacterized protein HemX
MASTDRQRYALQTIFSFFLGLMVLAFIGVGVNTFYQSPMDRVQPKLDDYGRQIDSLMVKADGRSLDATTQARVDRLSAQRNELERSIQDEMKGWMRNTSIILVIFATLVMSVSLVRSEQLRVLSNGLLLGGLFTMLYGIGWVIFSGNSTARFVVMAFALAVAIGLGYAKFVRQRAEKAAALAGVAASETESQGAASSDLEARVAVLEERAAAAAAALGGGESTHRR